MEDRNHPDRTDHHDTEDTTVMPSSDATVIAPRPRRRPAADGTRIDPHQMYDVAAPTRVTPAPPVSPIGVHTRGAVAVTPPHGMPVPPAVDTLNQILDDRDRIEADTRKAWTGRPVFRVRRGKARTVREVAARRAAQKLRHERHLEILETVRAYVGLFALIAVALLIVGMAAVSFMIMSGQMTWQPSR